MTHEEALSIAKENQQLKKRIKALEKENRHLSEINEFLEDAATFFAEFRRKSGKNSDRDILHAELCCETLKNANLRFPEICGAIVHSDCSIQYTGAAIGKPFKNMALYRS